MQICGRCRKPRPPEDFLPIDKKATFRRVCNPCQQDKSIQTNLLQRNRDIRTKYQFTMSDWNSFSIKCYNHGIKPGDYVDGLETQQGKCAICEDYKGFLLVIDHCHKEGHIRGLLCNACNVAIGLLKDDPKVLRSALTYISNTS